MPGLGDLFGAGSTFSQLFVWGVLNQIIGALGSPYFDLLTQEVNEKHPEAVRDPAALIGLVVRGFLDHDAAVAEAKKSGLSADKFEQLLEAGRVYISPPDLAQLFIRGFITQQDAEIQAAFSGLNPDQMGLLFKIAADAPGPGDLAIALRRGLIPEDSLDDNVPSFAGGIRQGRLSNIWTDMFKGLSQQWPSPTDALQAELEGQLDHDTAIGLYEKLGGDTQFYQWLFNTRGTAPTPDEGLELVRRGIIPLDGVGPDSVSLHQIFLEGPQRNKWFGVFKALLDYVTPPRSVVAMVRNGSFTDAQAAAELAKSGLTPELQAAYIAEGHGTASAGDKALTQSAIIALYEGRVIADTDAHNLLTALGYSDANATYLIDLADLRREIAATTAAVSRVQNLYIAHKITRDTAVRTLKGLAVPDNQVNELVQIWDLEEAVNVKQLTPAQITDAFYYEILTQDEATGELQNLGYTALDAWVLLSIKAKVTGGLPGKPAAGPNPLGTIP